MVKFKAWVQFPISIPLQLCPYLTLFPKIFSVK